VICLCVGYFVNNSIRSISTYSGQGVAKAGVRPSDHAIIHMAGTRPQLRVNEPPMTKEPLTVTPASPDEKLDVMSRINFGKIYTVEYNVKIKEVGMLRGESKRRLIQYSNYELTRS
jgi:hypothetical protein